MFFSHLKGEVKIVKNMKIVDRRQAILNELPIDNKSRRKENETSKFKHFIS
jgi:hypothetical protein